MDIEAIHHVSLSVSDLERSRRFYRDIIGLEEITRPNFSFPGAWFGIGGRQQLHLIVHANSTFRAVATIDTRDVHFALRVSSFRQQVESLRAKGYREDAPDGDPKKMTVRTNPVAGFPQIYILDPDRNIIELNSAKLD